MALLLAALVFFVIVASVSLPLLLGTKWKHAEIVGRRLAAAGAAPSKSEPATGLPLMRDELLSGVPILHRLLLRLAAASRLRAFLIQAGLKIRPGKLVLLMGVLTLGIDLALREMYRNSLLAAVAGILVGLAPLVVVSILRQRRLRNFERTFPEAIDLLSRAVRAGHAFSAGLELIGTELPEPVSGEFRTAFEEQKLGLPLRDAMLNLTQRVPLADLRFFVTALLIQKETGGNLAEILDNLAAVIRERIKIFGEVRVRTAQGRLSAMILIGMPPLLLLLLKGANPEYVRVLLEDPWGVHALAAALVLQVIGSILLWKIVRIEV